MSLITFHAIIAAAGSGQRMRSQRPKQYLPLAGRTVLEHAAQPFLDHPGLRSLVVVLAAGDIDFAATALARDRRVVVVTGGATRGESVAVGLAALAHGEGGVPVLVHDAARPCVPLVDIERLLEACGEEGALLAVPVRDTLKRMGACGQVAGTVERNGLWQALTPQAFPLDVLRSALAAHAGEVTDEAQAMERAGHAPRLIDADVKNFKITHPGDLELAAMILGHRETGS